ncbi:MAG: hypothetical protein ACREXU_11160, partial [Gammaproteobacteria bacterium]
ELAPLLRHPEDIANPKRLSQVAHPFEKLLREHIVRENEDFFPTLETWPPTGAATSDWTWRACGDGSYRVVDRTHRVGVRELRVATTFRPLSPRSGSSTSWREG